MSLTNQKLFKICLSMAVLAAFSQVGFAQQVIVLPSKAIDISELNSSPEENSISISTQNIIGHENLVVSVSVNLEVVPNLSAPVIKVDNVLYATDGDLVYKKSIVQSSWEIADRSEQPRQLNITGSGSHDLDCSCESEISGIKNLSFSSDDINQLEIPLQSLPAGTESKPFFSFNKLPSEFPYQFSEQVSSVFFQEGISARLDVVLGNDIQISFEKKGKNWILTNWLVLDLKDQSSLSNKNDRVYSISSEGFLPGSFSSPKNHICSTIVLVNILSINLADLGFVPPINHIASGWSPTLGAVYDRNVGFNLIFCSNLQTFSSFYTATLKIDNSNSGPNDKYPLFSSNQIEKKYSTGKLFKGTLT